MSQHVHECAFFSTLTLLLRNEHQKWHPECKVILSQASLEALLEEPFRTGLT